MKSYPRTSQIAWSTVMAFALALVLGLVLPLLAIMFCVWLMPR